MTASTLSDEVSKRATWSIVMGVVTAAVGALMILYPMIAGTITTIVIGSALIVVGIAQFIFALQSQSVGNFFLKIAISLLYGVTGIVLAFFPLAGVAALTGVVGSLFIVQAVLLTVLAFQLRPAAGWGWFLADGIADLAIGGLILANWPSSSFWAIGTLIGVSVLMTGISRIIIASKIRAGVGHLQNLARGTA